MTTSSSLEDRNKTLSWLTHGGELAVALKGDLASHSDVVWQLLVEAVEVIDKTPDQERRWLTSGHQSGGWNMVGMTRQDLQEIERIRLLSSMKPFTDEQKKVHYADWDKAHTTLDGLVRETPTGDPFAVVEFKFMFPFGFDIEKAIEKYYPQCQHNMMVTDMPVAHLSILTGAAQWYRAEIEADIFYQVELLKAEKAFWKCVEDGTVPGTPDVVVPLVDRIKIIDMSTSNEWASEAEVLIKTVTAVKKHEKAKKDIKKLMPADAKQASGKGVTIKLSKDGKMLVTFDEDAVEQADKDSNLFPPEAPKAKKPRAKKAANSNEAPAADAA
jgi:hypothetical protein